MDDGFFCTFFSIICSDLVKGMSHLKKNILLLLLSVICFASLAQPLTVKAQEQSPDNEFRVGLEASYAPFHWTQTSPDNGAVPIFGEEGSAYAGGYDVQIAKKIADGLGK